MSIYINLNDEETAALEEVAREERRTPNQQAAYMVVSGIESRKRMAEMVKMNAKLMAVPMGGQRAIPVGPGSWDENSGKGGDD